MLIGALAGLFIGGRLGARMRESLVAGLGLVTFALGLGNTMQSGNLIIPLLGMVLGILVGELLGIEKWLEAIAAWLQARFAGGGQEGGRARFIRGFLTASLVFCVGPLTFLGAIQDGMGLPGGFQQLAIKSVLDMVAATAFAASLGMGVLFSVFTVLILQGSLALLGSLLGEVLSAAMVAEMTAVGGLLLMGLALVLLELRPLRVANFLPALAITPLLTLLPW